MQHVRSKMLESFITRHVIAEFFLLNPSRCLGYIFKTMSSLTIRIQCLRKNHSVYMLYVFICPCVSFFLNCVIQSEVSLVGQQIIANPVVCNSFPNLSLFYVVFELRKGEMTVLYRLIIFKPVLNAVNYCYVLTTVQNDLRAIVEGNKLPAWKFLNGHNMHLESIFKLPRASSVVHCTVVQKTRSFGIMHNVYNFIHVHL